MWRQQAAYFPEGRTEESGVFVGGLQKNVIHRVAEPPPDLDEFEADIMASDAAHGTRALCIVVVRRHGQELDSTEILASRRFGAGNHVAHHYATDPSRHQNLMRSAC